MNLGKFVFAQVMEHLPLHVFHRCVVRYSGEHKVKRFSRLDQYLSMAFAQWTYRESLRDMEVEKSWGSGCMSEAMPASQSAVEHRGPHEGNTMSPTWGPSELRWNLGDGALRRRSGLTLRSPRHRSGR